MTSHRKHDAGRTLLRPLLLIGLLATSISASAQARYPSAQSAFNAFADAVATSDDHALAQILGPSYKTLIPQNVSQNDIYVFLADWAQRHDVIIGPSGKIAGLDVGKSHWLMPIPVVKIGDKWQFDMAAGAAEMRRRRLGRNELGAIAALRVLLKAQQDYAKGAGKGHYTSRLVSRPGTHDGLYWPAGPDQSSPLGPDALAMTADTPADAAYSGYRFEIVPSKDPASVSIFAWPAVYGYSGVHSFLATEDNVIRQNSSRSAHKSAAALASKQWEPVQ